MVVSHLLDDVNRLCTETVREYMRLIVLPGWQQDVYKNGQAALREHKKEEKYVNALALMNEKGIDNYTLENADITFMSEIAHAGKGVLSQSKKVMHRLERVAEGRNFKSHETYNEENEELCLAGLIQLCDLKKFVEYLHIYDNMIPSEKVQKFYDEYLPKIESLKARLTDAWRDVVGEDCEIKRDLERAKNPKNEYEAWGRLPIKYIERYRGDDDWLDKWNHFMMAASNEGFYEAHLNAAKQFVEIYDNIEEAAVRVRMFCDALNNGQAGMNPVPEKRDLADFFEMCLKVNRLEGDLKNICDELIESGTLAKQPDGSFRPPERNNREGQRPV